MTFTMRNIQNINKSWFFSREVICEDQPAPEGVFVDLPHTWNALDGQDGGGNYHRGVCYYKKDFPMPELGDEDEIWIELRGVNSSADVYLNENHLTRHDGGYSTFHTNLTPYLRENNTLVVKADNSQNDSVYPQQADFTFYGGIYRDVFLITVSKHHFELSLNGSSGLVVTPNLEGADANVVIEAYTSCDDGKVCFTVDGVGSVTTEICNKTASAVVKIPNAHLWNGLHDPFLYHAKAEYIVDGQVKDCIETDFGCRTFYVDGDKGFFLNGRSYPLRGVCRHQDRKDIGNAITREMMEEDLSLILEMGANTIRLAHYQHDQYFYDLCDHAGIIVWAEIPYISVHMPEGVENTLSQMRELILQNYNHASIICWGLSNETSIAGVTEGLIENHKLLNDLAHSLDKTRFTVMANISTLDITSELNRIPDQLSYNLYYGWYSGDVSDMDTWFDSFRTAYPKKAIGVSEYGADAAMHLQTGTPKRGDYTEQYQALFHEHMAKLLEERPYIWASHVWNMFDFGSDKRSEGGVSGINLKGLVTLDRKIKKDAFYLYKAYWSAQPIVHICGRRYIDRHEDETAIKVYSNCSEVTLCCDGQLVARQTGNKVFHFRLHISGEHTVEARSGEYCDSIRIQKVSKPNESYILAQSGITNWFERDEMLYPKGYFSLKDTISDIMAVPEAAEAVRGLQKKLLSAGERSRVPVGFANNDGGSQRIQISFKSILRNMLGDTLDPNELLEVNRALNQIKKPDLNT